MAKKFNPKDYSTVEERLQQYAEDYPDYRVDTDIQYFSDNADVVIIKATVYKSLEEQEKGMYHSTGLAEETRGAGYVNNTSHVENCETSAIGRALANAGYTGSGKRPSREEMDKVVRTEEAQKTKERNSSEGVKTTPNKTTKKVEGNHQETIDSFTELQDLLEWYNSNTDQDFKEEWFEAVQQKIVELRA